MTNNIKLLNTILINNYQTLLNDLVVANYDSSWFHFKELFSETDIQNLAIEKWLFLSEKEKLDTLKDCQFMNMINILIEGVSTYDIDDTMWAASKFREYIASYYEYEIWKDIEIEYNIYTNEQLDKVD